MLRCSLVLFAFAACGGGGGDPAPADSPSTTDGPASTIETITPCAGESATVTTDSSFKYTPMATTITAGQIVKFVMDPSHDVAPKTAADDKGLRVGFGATKCLKFTTAGTFNFKCTPHGFAGSITVN